MCSHSASLDWLLCIKELTANGSNDPAHYSRLQELWVIIVKAARFNFATL